MQQDPTEMATMQDAFGRQFPYLRLSITDACNFRCGYCLPNGYRKSAAESFLAVEEIENLARAFAELGVWKIRLTGGEPTLRKDFLEIAERVSAVGGVRTVAMTTNGYALRRSVRAYRAAGISAINVSVDSLDRANFQRITGQDKLVEILDGIEQALALGLEVKINAVLLKHGNADQVIRFVHWAREKPISLRFIELMQTGDNGEYFRQQHVGGDHVRSILLEEGWRPKARIAGAGPAETFAHPNHRGEVGIIAPYAKGFCATCNRLRVSARGALRLCLFGDSGYSLRPLLQEPGQKTELQEAILRALRFKQETHFLHQGHTGATPHLAVIGG